MPNTVTSQTLFDGANDVIVKVHVASDGSEETDLVVVDASTFSPVFTNCRLWKLDVSSAAVALQARLIWDATTDIPIIAIPASAFHQLSWEAIGGLPNNTGTGRTGDVLLTTLGLANGDQVTLIIHLKKVT